MPVVRCVETSYRRADYPRTLSEWENRQNRRIKKPGEFFSSDPNVTRSLQPLDKHSTYLFVDKKNAENILSKLNDQRKSNSFIDTVLIVENTRFSVSRNILAAFSPYFEGMFRSGMAECSKPEIEIKGIESSIMESILNYAYTGEFEITEENCQGLLIATNILQLSALRDACCEFFERTLNETNCIGIHCLAELHSCIKLRNVSLSYILRHFVAVTKMDEFLDIPGNKLTELLRDDTLSVPNEEFVVNALLKWFRHCPDERREEFGKALKMVRFPLVKPSFLYEISSFAELIDNPEWPELMNEAKMYHVLRERRAEMSSIRTTYRHSFKEREVILAIGGEDRSVVLRSAECFDPIDTHWYSIKGLPTAVSKHGVVCTSDNFIYVAGGEYPDGQLTDCLWRYDPVLETWSQLCPMIQSRAEFGFVAVDDTLYAIGGSGDKSKFTSIERYSIKSNTWTNVVTQFANVLSVTAVAHSGKVYVIGGYLPDQEGKCYQVYDPATNSWNALPPPNMPRIYASACVHREFIYLVGGYHNGPESTNQVERFNVKTHEWETVEPMLEHRQKAGIAMVGGKIYVFGGERGWESYHSSVEYYDPEEKRWAHISNLTSPRSWFSCTPHVVIPSRWGVTNEQPYVVTVQNLRQNRQPRSRLLIGNED